MSANLERLFHFIESGRLALRSTGSRCWSPDFSIVHSIPESVAERQPPSVCLVGAHYFSRPVMLDGASFTCVLSKPDDVRVAELRFEELWARGHDVLPVVRDVLWRALEETLDR
jgi:hypothetical protein